MKKQTRCTVCPRTAVTTVGRASYCVRCGVAEIARRRSHRRQRGLTDLSSLVALIVIITVIVHAVPTPTPRLSPLPPAAVAHYARAGSHASGLDSSLILAVIRAESGGDPRAVSTAGAAGMMQLGSATAHDCGIADRFDAQANVLCGSRTLALLVRRYGLSRALAAYNFGSAAVDGVGGHISRMPPETQRYVREVISDYDALQHTP